MIEIYEDKAKSVMLAGSRTGYWDQDVVLLQFQAYGPVFRQSVSVGFVVAL